MILCVDDERVILESLKVELKEIFGSDYSIEIAESGSEAFELFETLMQENREIPIVISDYIMPKMKGDLLLSRIHTLSPTTKTILLTGQATTEGVTSAVNSANLYRYIAKPWELEDLALTLKEAIKSFQQEHDLAARRRELENERKKVNKERKVIDTLSKILNEKISELEIQKHELEQISKELNITTIEKILIEQEAEKMSRTLSSLQNSIRNNLFIRSVLHSLVNMLQIQLSIDRRENHVIEDIQTTIDSIIEDAGKGEHTIDSIVQVIQELKFFVFSRLSQQRKKTDLNIHKTMTGYIKAVQRSLIGETIYFNAKPTHLKSMTNRVRQKYREILEDKSGEINIHFEVNLHEQDVYIGVLDFALINIIENMLTNSIRKVHESKREKKWIRLTSFDEVIDGEEFTILKWEDNGTGIAADRKESIFRGDSDKTEEGDHGIGLRDIKNTVESSGGFIREEGIPGEGAVFVIGFPKVTKAEEIDFDEEYDDAENPMSIAEFRGKHVYIVDDDLHILNLFKEFLLKSGIQIVETFSNAETALEKITSAADQVDLIISDIEMTPLDGIGFIEQLNRINSTIPVLIISGILFHGTKKDYSILKTLNDLGVKDILRKPVDFIELFDKMQRILKNRTK